MFRNVGTEEVRIAAEDAAWAAAQAEGERCSRLPEEEFRELIGEDTYFDGALTTTCAHHPPPRITKTPPSPPSSSINANLSS